MTYNTQNFPRLKITYSYSIESSLSATIKKNSQTGQMICGVPKGSILGPLLLIILINGLPMVLDTCKILIFADDGVVFFSERSAAAIDEVLNQEADIVGKWFANSHPLLNLK